MTIYEVKWYKITICDFMLYKKETTQMFQTKDNADKFREELINANKKLRNDFDLNIHITAKEVL